MNKFPFDLSQLPEYADFAYLEGHISPAEIQQMMTLWKDDRIQDAYVNEGTDSKVRDDFRKSSINFLEPGGEAQWVFNRIGQIALAVNAQRYRFDIMGFYEPLQLARYEEGHFFNWHLDFSAGQPSTRKLSVSVQLSDENEYEGGDLEFFVSGEIRKAPRKQGTVVIFPSFITHRVTPVTKGHRYSLVGWVSGIPYR